MESNKEMNLEEQIKQNAEEYANNEKQYYLEIGCYDLICEAFIVGAHGRDNEIEELKKRITELEDEVVQLANGENY